MFGLLACFATLLVGGAQEAPFVPGTQLGFLVESRKLVEDRWERAASDAKQKPESIRAIGKALGESRRRQGSLTDWMRSKDAEPETALRLVQVGGLFEAYAATVLLALDDGSSLTARQAEDVGRAFDQARAKMSPR